MTAPGHFKGECPYCGQHVEVPEELASDWVTCPDEACGKSFPPIPKLKHGAPPPGFTPKDIRASIANKPATESTRKHIEDNLELIGNVLLGFGVLGAIVAGAVLLAHVLDGAAGGSVAPLAIAAAIAFLLQGWIMRSLFHALAEIIRQLRKLNKRP